ncbi:malonate decarboxylase subunit epsilon [Cytobacillus depressus]|uniref:Malonyl CoA-acyl carrier protein transacylase n=1 Tax=Cytobacillus depressus TaxID=1602942 RepID=A0A6L3V8J0_9BACI|nr:malonate decarboxylase subunit epsilon [Cytobacillus depressus]KAB2336665.1 malonate decarboxylase subunit epsilon [Cytobacillus depressus]
MKLAFLFPGQGSQKPNMLQELPEHPAVEAVMQEATDTLEESVYNFDSKEALVSTVSVQISLLVSSVAILRVFEAEGIIPDIVAGHSAGAFGAAVACQSIGFADALRIIKLRGQLMEQVFPSGYGMGVITGIDEKTVKELANSCFTEKEPVYTANVNAPDQMTIAGSVAAINKVLDRAKHRGARTAELLNVSIPSHCSLLNPVSRSLHEELSKIKFRQPVIPYACNRTARLLRLPEQIREDLAYNVSYPVRWHDISSILCEHGTRLFIEMPPGNVLASLSKKALPGARSLSVDENGFENCLVLARRFCVTS